MATVPLILGACEGGVRPPTTLLVLAWLAAFGCFHAFEVIMKAPARRRAQVRPALLTWAGLTAVFGAPLLVLAPSLLAWAPFFAPLALIALWEVWRGSERAMLARLTSVLAAALMTPVAASLGSAPPLGPLNPELARAWMLGGFIGAYFLGTVPFVRSLIRGRGEDRWIIASGIWHAVSIAASVVAVARGLLHPVLVLLQLGLLARALWMPLRQRSRGPYTPLQIGLAEMAWCAAVTVVLLLP